MGLGECSEGGMFCRFLQFFLGVVKMEGRLVVLFRKRVTAFTLSVKLYNGFSRFFVGR